MKIIEKLAARQKDPFGCSEVVICCLGDSVTHGCFEFVRTPGGDCQTRTAPDEGYVSMIASTLRALFPVGAVSVVNCGIGGDSTEGALARFERDVARIKPDLVTVDLGLNNAVTPDPAAAREKYKNSLKGIFDKCREIGAECIYITPNMLNTYAHIDVPERYKGYAVETAKAQTDGTFDALIEAGRTQARESGVPIADAYADWRRMYDMGVDTTALLANMINHPWPKMHRLFADRAIECMFNN